jgi:hypothetical protein
MHARTLPFALLALTLGCSANNTPAPVEAGVDAEPDVEKDVFIGTGNLVLAWTVRGMPPATGCAAAGAASVRFPANFVQFTQDTVVPCTQGEVRINDTMASLAAITGELIDSSGAVIHTYIAEANVMANQTTMVPVRFEAPGSLRVRWTLNGGSPGPMCAGAMVMGVSFESRPVRTTLGSGCGSPTALFSNLQVGQARVVGTLISSERRAIGTAMGDVEITSGATTNLTLDFEAAVRVDP